MSQLVGLSSQPLVVQQMNYSRN